MPRSRLRKIAGLVAYLVFAVALLEATSFFAYRILFGGWFSYEASEREYRQAAGAPAPRSGRDAEVDEPHSGPQALYVPHPYLGYVYDPAADNEKYRELHFGVPISQTGFVDTISPVQRRGPHRFVVGIVGGSVAYQVASLGGPALEQTLRESARLRGKQIVIVRLALGGWKQPQQVMALAYVLAMGGEFDAVVNIDGFNEVALAPFHNVRYGVAAHYPRTWYDFAPSNPGSFAGLSFLRRRLASWASGLRYSVTAHLAWKIADANLGWRLAKPDWTTVQSEELSFSERGDRVHVTQGDLFRDLAWVWAEGSRTLAQIATGAGALYVHALQPNQYTDSKPLSEEERRSAVRENHPYGVSAARGYPHLRREGQLLRAEGIDFLDLSTAFENEHGTLYVDSCCHFNARGNEILARRIGREIIALLDARAAAPVRAGLAPPGVTGPSR